MTTTRAIRPRLAVLATAGALLAGCVAQPKPLYYWGNYQPELYVYFKKEESPEAQLAKLEETSAQAQSKGLELPPGFRAHMGLLYLQMGQLDKAQVAFQAETARFPESKPYMDFLLKNKKPGAATAAMKPAAPKPVVAKAPVKSATTAAPVAATKPAVAPAVAAAKPAAPAATKPAPAVAAKPAAAPVKSAAK